MAAPKPVATELPPPAPLVRPHCGRLPRGLSTVVLGLDVLVLTAAVTLAWALRGVVALPPAHGADVAVPLSPLLVALWVGLIAIHAGYRRGDFGCGTSEFARVGKASVVAAFAASTLCFFSGAPLSRGFLVCAFVLGAPLLLAERVAVRGWIRRRRLAGSMTHRVLALGSGAAVRDLATTLERERRLGFELVACTLTDGSTDGSAGGSAGGGLPVPIAGSVADLVPTCRRLGIETVMVAGSTDLVLRTLAWDLEGQDVELVVVPNLAEVCASRLALRPLGGLPFLHVERPQAHRARGWLKRAFDLVVASTALLLVAPLMVVVAACVKLGDGGPVFYRQVRVGLNGALFEVLKFRSMSVDADRIEAQLRAAVGHSGALFKLEHDPRISRIGRFIRRQSIDELPQLFNVLTGSMSLVGPRPHQQWEVDTYSEVARRRLHVRPGMTGLWQVSGRSRLTWEESLRLDLYYRDNWSILADLVIMGRTLKAVVGRDGAY